MFFFFKQKTAYEMRISDWSSDVCSSDLATTGIDAPVFKDGSRVPATYSLANPVVKSTVGQADNPYDTINVAFGGKYTADRFTLSAEGSYVRSHGPFYYRSATIHTRAGRADLRLAGDAHDVAVPAHGRA